MLCVDLFRFDLLCFLLQAIQPAMLFVTSTTELRRGFDLLSVRSAVFFFCYGPLYPLKNYLCLKSSRADRNRQRKHRTSRTKPRASAPKRRQRKGVAPPTASQIQFSRSCITQTASAHTQMHPVGRTLPSEQGRGQQAPRRNPGQALQNRGKMLVAYGFLFVYFFNFLL